MRKLKYATPNSRASISGVVGDLTLPTTCLAALFNLLSLFHRSGHQRSASDSFAYLGAAATDESEFVNAYFAQNLTKSKNLDSTFSQTKESGDQVASSQNVDESANKAAKTIPGSKTELTRAKQYD
ncbi:hypothetical protein C2S52_014170 [Perilla frutescens var. hirtella]|nr:hypothetical protein C2S52_014170 [Perilla frutescens var. hirtella]